MDEFKPEDELKPDTSDRRPTRPRKTSSAPKTPVSRQRMMMGIGVLVLLLLVIGIGSALNGPNPKKSSAPNTAASGNEKNIDLSGSSTMSGPQGNVPVSPGDVAVHNGTAGASPQPISVPPVSPTPTQAAPVELPHNQQRVELPGDLNNALTNQQGQVDSAAQGAMNGSSLPTAPATVSGNNSNSGGNSATAPAQSSSKPAPTRRPVASHSSPKPPVARQSSKPAASAKPSAPAAQGTPGGSYTLQLSSASRSDTLNAWAKKQNLSNYHVYQTTRNGKPWYVLVSGSYATPADAKRAVASLPAEVQAQKPWVKPVSQVKKEAGR